MGGRLTQGLGEEFIRRGLTVEGRELVDEFRSLDFQSQVSLVSEDLWDELSACNRRVIANSFGAYLFLHAQADRKPFAGKVLLLSPIVGEFSDEETLRTFVPPRSRRIFEMLELGTYPIPLDCEIHTGENDWQSNPVSVLLLASYLKCQVSVAAGAGHMLQKEYVRSVLDKWIY